MVVLAHVLVHQLHSVHLRKMEALDRTAQKNKSTRQYVLCYFSVCYSLLLYDDKWLLRAVMLDGQSTLPAVSAAFITGGDPGKDKVSPLFEL